jgi:hypothetical protein
MPFFFFSALSAQPCTRPGSALGLSRPNGSGGGEVTGGMMCRRSRCRSRGAAVMRRCGVLPCLRAARGPGGWRGGDGAAPGGYDDGS